VKKLHISFRKTNRPVQRATVISTTDSTDKERMTKTSLRILSEVEGSTNGKRDLCLVLID